MRLVTGDLSPSAWHGHGAGHSSSSLDVARSCWCSTPEHDSVIRSPELVSSKIPEANCEMADAQTARTSKIAGHSPTALETIMETKPKAANMPPMSPQQITSCLPPSVQWWWAPWISAPILATNSTACEMSTPHDACCNSSSLCACFFDSWSLLNLSNIALTVTLPSPPEAESRRSIAPASSAPSCKPATPSSVHCTEIAVAPAVISATAPSKREMSEEQYAGWRTSCWHSETMAE
mmetsp:Transcript_23630/g.66858  ORF Transcript_23630/g.66858 Transcript_23630/m.66858 type:complete len:236 (-) Transcript_23630:762-1469(-)